VPGRVGVDVVTVEFLCAKREDGGTGGGRVFDHDVEVELLLDGGGRPGRPAVVGGKLEREARRVVVGGDDHPVVALVRDGLSKQGGVEARERRRVRAVKDHMM
jgi:hypothetical protein